MPDDLRARLNALVDAAWPCDCTDPRVDAVRATDLRALLAATDPAPDEARCRCDGAMWFSDAENKIRHPFLISAECPIHSPTPINAAPTPPTVAPSDPVTPCPTSGCSGTASRGQFCNRCAYGNPTITAEPDSIVEILTSERDRLGLSMGAVAERTGASKSSVHAWEHGIKSPSLANAQAWAEALGRRLTVAPSDLPVATGDAASERTPWVAVPGKPGYHPAPVHADDTDAQADPERLVPVSSLWRATEHLAEREAEVADLRTAVNWWAAKWTEARQVLACVTVIEITAIGERVMLAKRISHRGEPVPP